MVKKVKRSNMTDIICPKCKGILNINEAKLVCKDCKQIYPIEDGIPVLLHDAIKNDLVTNYIDHYKQDAKSFDYYRKKDPQLAHDMKRLAQVITHKIPSDAVRILDVGAGSNWVAKFMIPKRKEVYAVDISHDNIKKARDIYHEEKYHGFVADAYSLPFRPNYFDVIIASEIIEHVVDPSKFVSVLTSYLKVGGVLLISTPYKENIPQHLCIHCNKLTPANAHLHSFNKEKILSLFNEENIQNVKIITFSNKLLSLMRFYPLLKIMPYGIWRVFDWLLNRIIPKPAKMLVKYYK